MTHTYPLMAGKKGLVMGMANRRSIAWGIANKIYEHGGELAFSYQGEALGKRVKPLATEMGAKMVIPCDVSNEKDIDSLFATLSETWSHLDFVVHAIAYSDKEQLKGRYVDTSRDNFLTSMAVSCYSFTAICRGASQMMQKGGSLLTLTYLGAERVMPHYNVMGIVKAALETSVKYLAEDFGREGIRVNSLSAGPVKTLAASGIRDFRYIQKWNQLNSPLRRNVTLDDIGNAGVYLLSPLSSGVTGENHHVDCGYHVVGMKAVDAPDISAVQDDM